MAAYTLPFEKPLLDLQNKIEELRRVAREQGIDAPQDVARLESQLAETRRGIYAALTPWQKVLVSRHPRRPYTRDYIAAFVKDFTELHGDRLLSDDLSIVGGLGWIGAERVMVIGEGGSGGALGIGVANRILILEHSYYSVISPEGCAAILWKNRSHADTAATALKLTAPDLVELGIADEIIPEPLGGAHSDPETAAEAIRTAILKNLAQLKKLTPHQLLDQRYAKFRTMGIFKEGPVPALTPPPLPVDNG